MPNDPEDPLSRGQYWYDLSISSADLQIYKIVLDLLSLSAHSPRAEMIAWPAAPDNQGERKLIHIETGLITIFPLKLFIVCRAIQDTDSDRHPCFGYQGVAGDGNIIGVGGSVRCTGPSTDT